MPYGSSLFTSVILGVKKEVQDASPMLPTLGMMWAIGVLNEHGMKSKKSLKPSFPLYEWTHIAKGYMSLGYNFLEIFYNFPLNRSSDKMKL
ncbi:hypothetical protein DV515_00004162 [Chloebia gouldiae]|uniref:Uncharacterized protein n=1 Tax=Chloebia gouldiae TaxID=44316 RepID=A0A3L8SRP6_CHLGU|nr:hypothetical protein DV515_00004162 [Chloebia gouldiae]